MQILVATDGLPHSDLAVKFASRLAGMIGGEMTILTVLRRRDRNRKADAVLDRACELIDPEQFKKARKQVRRGNPVNEIIQEAITGNYDIAVLGWRPERSQLRLTKTTTHQVIEKVPCPVAIAKSNGSPIKRILICDSGVMDPPLLDRFTEHLSSLMAGHPYVTVLHVMSQISAGPEATGWQLEASAQDLIEAHSPEGEILEHDTDVLEEINIHPQLKIRHGLVVDEILAEAQEGNYDLAVIGAHHNSGTLDLLLDDLAQQIIDHIDRSILIVK